MTQVRCSVCQQRVYRTLGGRIVWHTVNVAGDNYGDPLKATVCRGSEGGRP